MVLIRRVAVLGLVLLAACSESLFGAHRAGQSDDGGISDDGGVGGVVGCADPCNADAAAEFDGTVHGAHDRWRYLDDHRDRTWTPMTVGAQVMTGADPPNHITTCAAHPEAPACTSLPGALLVSDGASTADPAIELTVATAQVIDLELMAFVPSNESSQTIRLYRNSREDVLFTGLATTGTPFDQKITLDALPGDRFLVAVAPISGGATDVGLQMVARATGTTFPSTCKLAVPFTNNSGNTTPDLCGGPTFNYFTTMGNTGKQPMLSSGPFPELGKAATIPAGEYFQRGMDSQQTFLWPQEFTLQLWFLVNKVDSLQFTTVFSDWYSSICGGVGIQLSAGSGNPTLEVHVCKAMSVVGNTDADMAYQLNSLTGWQFIRVARTTSTAYVCLNGIQVVATPVVPTQGSTGYLISLGREDSQPNTGAFFDGQVDDVRVFSSALPCDAP